MKTSTAHPQTMTEAHPAYSRGSDQRVALNGSAPGGSVKYGTKWPGNMQDDNYGSDLGAALKQNKAYRAIGLDEATHPMTGESK